MVDVPETEAFAPQIFNSPIETGTRSLVILVATCPRALDLQRLVQLDHLVVHARDVGGQFSLHPETPRRATEMIVRRGTVERGLHLMASRGLVNRIASAEGILYSAGDEAGAFLELLRSPYMMRLKQSAAFLANLLDELGDEGFERLVEQHFERWALEFHPADAPGV